MRQFIKQMEWVPIVKYIIKSDHWFYPGQTFCVKSTYNQKIAQKQLKRIKELNKRRGFNGCKVTLEIINSYISKPTGNVVWNIYWRHKDE